MILEHISRAYVKYVDSIAQIFSAKCNVIECKSKVPVNLTQLSDMTSFYKSCSIAEVVAPSLES